MKNVEASIIVADGPVDASSFQGCVVIARGDVKCPGGIDASVVIAGGKVEGRNGVFFKNFIRENCAKQDHWVRFFQTRDAGIEFEARGGALVVTNLDEKQPPKAAGLRTGDLLLKINGKPATSVEDARRLLRKAVGAEKAEFVVRRGEKRLELTASYADWKPSAARSEPK